MGQSMGMLDFFVLEAGEYLERLDALAQAPAGRFSSGDEFVRIVRAWRGGALMASQRAMARAAQGLEAAGRALRDGRLGWDERVRGEVIRAVDDCKTHLHRIRTPAPEDAARAEEIGASLERLAGHTVAGTRAAGAGLDAGGRAFVAREAAAIASALDHAAQGLSADPAAREALGGVMPAMSALRGVAVLSDLAPLADLLAGVEGAVKEVLATSGAVGPAVPAVFDAAAKALARVAREVVDVGRPATDSAQAEAFATALLGAFASAGQVLPIAALFYDDGGPHVVTEGRAPPPLSRVEIVSQGEFLERAAEELMRAASPVVRDLKLFGMAATLRPLAGAAGSPVSGAVGSVAEAGRGAIDRGAAGRNVEAFAAAVADAARALRTVETGDEPAVVAQLEAAAGRLNALAAPPRPRTTRVVPELAAMPAHAVAPVAVGAPPLEWHPATSATGGTEEDLAWGYVAMERLIVERGLPIGSLEELLGAPDESQATSAAVAEEEGVVAIESLAPDEDQRPPAAVVAPPPGSRPGTGAAAPDELDETVVPIQALAPDEEIVPIESLLYRGQDALRRALDLKAELAALASTPGKASSRLYELQREVFDLVELGLRAS